MKKKIGIMILIFAMALLAAEKVSAGETFYIPISCTIPAIPGINAPIISDQKKAQPEDNSAASETKSEEEPVQAKEKIIPEELPSLKKDRTEHMFFLSEEHKAKELVQTIYSR